MAGPLPDPKSRRRNAPTIPTTELPAAGRQDDPPAPPDAYTLGEPGQAWWDWAWHLPQACAWDDGALFVAARRASLEDDLGALDDAEDQFAFEALLAEFADSADPEVLVNIGQGIDFIVGRLKGLASGRLAVMKEMRELDNKLGLNPEALAKLRWKIIDVDGQEQPAPEQPKAKKKKRSGRRGRLSVVPDPK